MDLSQWHVYSVWAFLGFYLIKTGLLFALAEGPFIQFRKKTLVLEIVLGTILLGTGILMVLQSGHPDTWMLFKITFLLAIIPIGIIAFRNRNKGLALLGIAGFGYVYAMSQTASLTLEKPHYKLWDKAHSEEAIIEAKSLYIQNCAQCHGMSGDGMLLNAPNLRTTRLGKGEVAKIIAEGKGNMPGYEATMSEQQISAMAEYVTELRNAR